ncbi:MAG TPA: DUF4147 domain-containing protein [Vicinamibacterales bacterium]|nr:DUF4147 domain-containing protein [Vicinamibacterales bacterium]HPW22105.1 DUF4147 domain-containing protein [Vicinamibacterales bacterium]
MHRRRGGPRGRRRSQEGPLNSTLAALRVDALAACRVAIAAVDAGACVARAMAEAAPAIAAAPAWRLVAAGKAAGSMTAACLAAAPRLPVRAMAVAPEWPGGAPDAVEAFAGGHPAPNSGSLAAGQRALAIAAETGEDDLLVVLLSGGASALMESLAEGVSLADLRAVTTHLLRAGADITALNAVRKHLSRVKGGRLAAAAPGRTLALAVSDVVGDDLSVIASGPTVGDPTRYQDAVDVIMRFGGPAAVPASVWRALASGAAGLRPDTPKPGSPALARACTRVIGSQAEALDAACREGLARGYAVHRHGQPVVGEARDAASEWAARIAAVAAGGGGPAALLSSGETTVTVTGGGRGGRNQELALALARPLAGLACPAVAVSLGTDGVDGPTDAAGAIVDTTTIARASAAGLAAPDAYLNENDSYAFFDALGDLVRTGPTGTNVGDIQIALLLSGGPRCD